MNDFRINSDHKVESGFKIPENYFENFSEDVFLKIKKPEVKVLSVFYRRKTWISSVAAVLVISLLATFYAKMATDSKETNITLENYITTQSEISQYDLVTILDLKDIEEIEIDLKLDDKNIEEELSDSSEIESYLTE